MTRPQRTRIRTIPLLVGVAVLAVVAACAPGPAPRASNTASLGPVSRNVGSGKITLTVWDQNTDKGIDEAQQQLNAAFHRKHPNVTIKRVSRSFTDLKTTLKLALSGDNPPDVVQANQGYPDMGAFVKAGLLRPMNDYADLYGWRDYYPSSLLKLNSFSRDGKTWQGGDLYGVSQTGELVGLYYNKSVLAEAGIRTPPKTVAELTADLKKVKATGKVPLGYGDVDKYPGIHLYGFVLSALAGRDKVNDLVKSSGGAWTDASEVDAAKTIQRWQRAGYLTPGANGISIDDAVASFGQGKSGFLVTGTWYEATLHDKNVGFTALTPPGAANQVTMGGEGLSWSITSKTRHANAAAAYIDFIAGRSSTATLIKNGNLPVVVPDSDTPPAGVAADITREYRTISRANGITPYLDYTTPTFYDTLTAAAQDLVAGRLTPAAFCQKLQADYAAFGTSNR